jgi:hypothetical protein
MSDHRFARWGMSMRTPKGSVDLVPLFRRLDGDMDAPILAGEKKAAVLALTHLGTPMDYIHRALNMSHIDVKSIIIEHGMEPVVLSEPEPVSYVALAYTSNSQRRNKRKADLELIGGRLVHPDAPHGTNRAYTEYGCHCVPCSAAHAVKLAEHRAKKQVAA